MKTRKSRIVWSIVSSKSMSATELAEKLSRKSFGTQVFGNVVVTKAFPLQMPFEVCKGGKVGKLTALQSAQIARFTKSKALLNHYITAR